MEKGETNGQGSNGPTFGHASAAAPDVGGERTGGGTSSSFQGGTASFGAYSWPWVDGSNARCPYFMDGFEYCPLLTNFGSFGTSGTRVSYTGFQLPAFVRFLQLHGIEQPSAACNSATVARPPGICTILLTHVAQ